MGFAKPAWPVLQPGQPLARGLVAAYGFHEGAGLTLNDLSGNNNKATIATGVPWSGGAFGSCLSLNGTFFQYASTAQMVGASSLSAATLSAWVFSTANQANFSGLILTRAASLLCLGVNNGTTNQVWFDWNNTLFSTNTGYTLPNNKWTLLTVVFDTVAGTVLLYANGAKVFSTTATLTPQSVNGNWFIGKDPSNSAFAGLVDGVLIYNRALSAAEVAQLYFDSFTIYRKPSRWWEVLVAGGATSYSFPTAAWLWNGQAPALAFANAATQKSWVWHAQPPTQSFAVAAAQKAWLWNAQAFSFTFPILLAQKAWAWTGNAASFGFGLSLAQRAWRWLANPPSISGLVNRVIRPGMKILGQMMRRS